MTAYSMCFGFVRLDLQLPSVDLQHVVLLLCALYAVCSVEVQYKVGDQFLPAASVSEVVPEWGKRLLDEAPVPLPPRGPPVQRCWHASCSKLQQKHSKLSIVRDNSNKLDVAKGDCKSGPCAVKVHFWHVIQYVCMSYLAIGLTSTCML